MTIEHALHIASAYGLPALALALLLILPTLFA